MSEEVRKKLMEAKTPGSRVSIEGGLACQIQEIIDYRIFTAKWRNIILQYPLSGKVVLEIGEGDKVKVWRPCSSDDFAEEVMEDSNIVVFRGEDLFREESVSPLVDIDDEPFGMITYAVYTNASRTKGVCVEWWPADGPEAYYLDKEILLSEIDIFYL